MAEIDIAHSEALAGQPAEALSHLHALADHVLNRREPDLNLDLVWAYSSVFAMLGEAERAAVLQGTHEVAMRGDDTTAVLLLSRGDEVFMERFYRHARHLITPDEWELARERGRRTTPEQAIADAKCR